MSWETIGMGLLAGAGIGAAGYLKSYEFGNNHENFKLGKFLKTTILGGMVGGLVPLTGQEANAVITMLECAGVTAIVENVVKAFIRKVTGGV